MALIINIITFPGYLFLNAIKQFFCRLSGVPIFGVDYFNLKNNSDAVINEKSESIYQNLMISFGPLLTNFAVASVLTLPASVWILSFEQYKNVFYWFLLWVGFSIFAQSFPTRQDGDALYAAVIKNEKVNIILKIIAFLPAGFIWLLSRENLGFLKLIYAAAMVWFTPSLLAALFL